MEATADTRRIKVRGRQRARHLIFRRERAIHGVGLITASATGADPIGRGKAIRRREGTAHGARLVSARCNHQDGPFRVALESHDEQADASRDIVERTGAGDGRDDNVRPAKVLGFSALIII